MVVLRLATRSLISAHHWSLHSEGRSHCTPQSAAEAREGESHCTSQSAAEAREGESHCTPQSAAEAREGESHCTPQSAAEAREGESHCTPQSAAEAREGESHCTPQSAAEARRIVLATKTWSATLFTVVQSSESASGVEVPTRDTGDTAGGVIGTACVGAQAIDVGDPTSFTGGDGDTLD
ncbi:hypothetical protein J6590_102469 [Homalodisca vitripennis]|nr:hypothetical protein J6590_102469 [Homalodisca vitripennis]